MANNNDEDNPIDDDYFDVNLPSPMDPQENPVGTDHLPAVGEVGVGEVPYHDPLTTDTTE